MLHSITFDFDVKAIIQLAEESRREIQLSPLVKEMVASRMDHWAVVREANLGEQHLFLSTEIKWRCVANGSLRLLLT